MYLFSILLYFIFNYLLLIQNYYLPPKLQVIHCSTQYVVIFSMGTCLRMFHNCWHMYNLQESLSIDLFDPLWSVLVGRVM